MQHHAAGLQADTDTDRQPDRQTESRQVGRQAGRQADSHIARQATSTQLLHLQADMLSGERIGAVHNSMQLYMASNVRLFAQ